jgi:putative ABC transport system substrate-binding protein
LGIEVPTRLFLRGDSLVKAEKHQGYNPWCFIVVIAFFLVSPTVLNISIAGDSPPNVSLLVSDSIRPYVEAVDGFREVYPGDSQVVYFKEGKTQINSPQDLWVAVGPQAMRELWTHNKIPRKIYMMVLHPQDLLGAEASACGIALDISPIYQARILKQTFPKVKTLGILYNPKFNQQQIDDIRKAADLYELSVLELRVESKKQIPKVLNNAWKKMDVLWLIPDRTVISEAIIEYLSKECLLKRVALLGFNRFFLQSGAAMAFVIDYMEVGRRAAQTAQSFSARGLCWPRSLALQFQLNEKVLGHLGWAIPNPLPPDVELKK